MRKYKSIGIAVAILFVIVALLVATKAGQIFVMIDSGKNQVPPAESINVFTAENQAWSNTFTAMGTIEADEGIDISAEVAGKVQKILFKSGERVAAGTIILTQESGNETAQLSAANARLRLTKANYERMAQLRKKDTVSQNELDSALEQNQSAQGDVDNLRTTLEKKIVKAPFAGRLGIRKVDLGQDLPVGTPIVSLQATNRVRVNFPVPQHWLVQMTKGLPISVELGDGTNTVVKGEVTAIGAEINAVTRNATVQSSLENSSSQFIPGMAVQTTVTLANPQPVLVVPVMSVIFAPFGDTLFVIEKDKAGALKARQQFVRLGKARGDFIEIVDGIKAGDQVASAGAFKLFNGQSVVISKTPMPEFKTEPKPVDN
ncbi:MAG: efflux RND transporter periplasmic adaptor subunit [Pseudomonadota bacterium]